MENFNGKNFTKSNIVPWTYHWQERHQNRREAAIAMIETASDWAKRHNVELSIKGKGEENHTLNVWTFRKPKGFARWYPTTARLHCCRDWTTSKPFNMKVFDVEQLLWFLKNFWVTP